MTELASILQSLVNEVACGRPATLCTLVRTKGSTPRSAGAAMLVRSDGSTMGTLGGGCVEAEIQRLAIQSLTRTHAELLEFNLEDDYGYDDGLRCGGRIFVVMTPFSADTQLGAVHSALTALANRESATIPLVVEQSESRLEYRLHVRRPPTLVIAGAGHVGQTLARLAVNLDFRVVVIDDRPDYACKERFPESIEVIADDVAVAVPKFVADNDCFVVIVTRGHQNDMRALDAVVRRQTAYVGLIGGKRKAKVIFQELMQRGVTQEQLDRVHRPIGISIGAETVTEIAVSIAAELIQVRRQLEPHEVEGPTESSQPIDGKAAGAAQS